MEGITQKAINELFVRTDILERELKNTNKKLKKCKRLSVGLFALLLLSRVDVKIEKNNTDN